jgi:hypothetical protein
VRVTAETIKALQKSEYHFRGLTKARRVPCSVWKGHMRGLHALREILQAKIVLLEFVRLLLVAVTAPLEAKRLLAIEMLWSPWECSRYYKMKTNAIKVCKSHVIVDCC